MQGCESPLLRLRNASDNTFYETLKHVMSCLGGWAFPRKARERGFSEIKRGLTLVILGVCQQLKGAGGACHGIPAVLHLAGSLLPGSQHLQQGKRRLVTRWWKQLPGGAGDCRELHHTEGHSGVSMRLPAHRAPRTRVPE